MLKLFLHCFTCCVRCLLGGHNPAEPTGAPEFGKLHISLSVSSELLMISSRIACLTAFWSTGRSTVHFTFQITPQKKKYVLLGPVNEWIKAHHRHGEASAAETNGEA